MTTKPILNRSDITLNSREIAQRLPHAGKMCLLHEVIEASSDALTAEANSHLDADNPLRLDGKIATVNGIEYAAQAMAIHGSLLLSELSSTASETPQTGYIATVRNIQMAVPFIPETGAALVINVQQLMSDSNGFTYQFHIDCEQQRLISGKITVFLTGRE